MRGLPFLALGTVLAVCGQHRVVLWDELVRVQAMERKTVIVFPLTQQGAEVEIRFESKLAGEGVQVRVYEAGMAAPLAESKYEGSGALRVAASKDREYSIVVENLRQRLGYALVDLRVALVFGAGPIRGSQPQPSTPLDPQRRLITILASLSLFGAIVVFAVVRLGRPVWNRLHERD
jgi:hypothetical protein